MEKKAWSNRNCKLYDVNLIRYRDLYDMSCMKLSEEDFQYLLFDWDGEPEISKNCINIFND